MKEQPVGRHSSSDIFLLILLLLLLQPGGRETRVLSKNQVNRDRVSERQRVKVQRPITVSSRGNIIKELSGALIAFRSQ